jgi:hypothetical protein
MDDVSRAEIASVAETRIAQVLDIFAAALNSAASAEVARQAIAKAASIEEETAFIELVTKGFRDLGEAVRMQTDRIQNLEQRVASLAEPR